MAQVKLGISRISEVVLFRLMSDYLKDTNFNVSQSLMQISIMCLVDGYTKLENENPHIPDIGMQMPTWAFRQMSQRPKI